MPGVVIPEAFAEAFDRFRQSLLNDGKAARTVESYCSDIEKFLLHLEGQHRKSPASLTRADVTHFIAGLSGRGFRPATVNKAVNSLSCFTQYLQDQGIIPNNLKIVEPKKDRIKIATGSEKEVSVIDEQELNSLLALANNPAKMSIRNRLIILSPSKSPSGRTLHPIYVT